MHLSKIKNMIINEQSVIGDLVTENYAYSDVFSQYKIDFCCGGNASISEACDKRGFDENSRKALIEKLNSVTEKNGSDPMDPKAWPLDFLVDYIEKKHHRYIEENVPLIRNYVNKIARVHGKNHPALIKIAELFKTATDDLIPHLKKEELVLFPNVRDLLNRKESVNPEELRPKFEQVMNHLSDEHNHEGELFREIAALSNDYQEPDEACNTWRVAFAKLKEFEEDLHFHIHLENNILFKGLRQKLGDIMV